MTMNLESCIQSVNPNSFEIGIRNPDPLIFELKFRKKRPTKISAIM